MATIGNKMKAWFKKSVWKNSKCMKKKNVEYNEKEMRNFVSKHIIHFEN